MPDPDLVDDGSAGSLRFGVTLSVAQYRQLHAIALHRWRGRYVRRLLPDGAVQQLVAELVDHALEQIAAAAEDRRVAAANRRHVRAVPLPWPTGRWCQDEVDEAVRAVQAGWSVDEISEQLCRQQAEVRELLDGFGLLRGHRMGRRSA